MTRKYSRKRSRTRRIRPKRSRRTRVNKRPRTKRMRTKRHSKQLGGGTDRWTAPGGRYVPTLAGSDATRARINHDINMLRRQRRNEEIKLQRGERRSNLTGVEKIKDSCFSCCGARPTQTQSDAALDLAIARRKDKKDGERKKVPLLIISLNICLMKQSDCSNPLNIIFTGRIYHCFPYLNIIFTSIIFILNIHIITL